MSNSHLTEESSTPGRMTSMRWTSIALVSFFSPETKSYGVLPLTGDSAGPDARALADLVYAKALDNGGGSAPALGYEWDGHVQSACASERYRSYRALQVLGEREKRQTMTRVATAEETLKQQAQFTAWMSVSKDDNGRLSFWRSLPGEVTPYDADTYALLELCWADIEQRAAVLPNSSSAEWELDHLKSTAAVHPDADLEWYGYRVRYAAQRVLWDTGILHTRVEITTTRGPRPDLRIWEHEYNRQTLNNLSALTGLNFV